MNIQDWIGTIGVLSLTAGVAFTFSWQISLIVFGTLLIALAVLVRKE